MFSPANIARIVAGRRLRPAARTVRGFVHDSRAVGPGDLFVALPGRHTDGHHHLTEAYDRGACGALISSASALPGNAVNAILVRDVLAALQSLARAWRADISGEIIAITGSNGKTTTKQLIAHLLSADRAVHAAPENFNTEIGLPLAVLAMANRSAAGVFELGTSAAGDIRFLAELLAPTVGVLTGVGPSHVDAFRTLNAIANEKWSLADSLPAEAPVYVNADSAKLRARMTQRSSSIGVGLRHGTLRGRVRQTVPRLIVETATPAMTLDVPLLGRHNATNALLAAAAALGLGMSPREVERRIRTAPAAPRRLRLLEAGFGWILDDTYNANPASTAAAVAVLRELGAAEDRRIFLFGDMLALGRRSAAAHHRIIDIVERTGIDTIIPVGERTTAACRQRMASHAVFLPRDQVVSYVRHRCADKRSIVLVKGSRGMHMEDLVDALAATDA